MFVTRVVSTVPLGRGEAGWLDLGKSCCLRVPGLAGGELTSEATVCPLLNVSTTVLGSFLSNYIATEGSCGAAQSAWGSAAGGGYMVRIPHLLSR